MTSNVLKLFYLVILLISSSSWAQEAKFEDFIKLTYEDCQKEVSTFLDSNQTPSSWKKSPLNYAKVCECSKEKVQSDLYIKRVISSTSPQQILISKSKSFNSRVELKLLSSLFSCLSFEMDKRLLDIKYSAK